MACWPRPAGSAEPKETGAIFAVSDSSSEASYHIACKALKQFPKAKPGSITCCPQVQALQDLVRGSRGSRNAWKEIDHIVEEAKRRGGGLAGGLCQVSWPK